MKSEIFGKIKKVLSQSFYLPFALMLNNFVTDEFLFTGILIVFIFLSFKIEYHKREWILFVVGIFFGVLIEVVTASFGRLQHWEHASLFGIPLWLPIVWGYAFIYMRRIGDIVIGEKECCVLKNDKN